jgi:hypothetical protein
METRAAYHITRLPEREEGVQQAIRDGLELLGYTVLSTSVRRVRYGYGATPGIPDLLISRDTWAPGCFLALEVKGTKTRLSAAQRRLADDGRIAVVRSWEEARYVVENFEREMALGAIG